MNWNLEKLFKSSEECYNSFDQIDNILNSLVKYKGVDLTSKLLEELLNKAFECKELAYKCLVYGSLRFYDNTQDEKTIKLKKDVEDKNTDVINALFFLDEMILNVGKEKINVMILENTSLQKYKLYIDDLYRRHVHHIQSPEIKDLTKQIANLINEYLMFLKTIKFAPIKVGEKTIELSSSNIAKYIQSRDDETRKQAFISLTHGYQEKKEYLAKLLNDIYKKRVQLAKLQGYKGVLEKSLDDENIDPKIVEELINVVKKKINLLQKYMRIKAKILNFRNPHLYDLGIPLDNDSKHKFSLEEAPDIIKSAIEILGNDYTNIALSLIQNHHIDASLREEKHQSMTFSWYGYSFLNYHETYNDIKNLIHELGHSINDTLSMNLPFPYRISSVFIGETASIINEILDFLRNSIIGKNCKKSRLIKTLNKRCEYDFYNVLIRF